VYLMPSRAGKKRSGSSYLRPFKAAARAAGCGDITIHDIRRKRLTDLQLNQSVDVAQKVAGHGSPQMTRRYFAAAETPVDLPE